MGQVFYLCLLTIILCGFGQAVVPITEFYPYGPGVYDANMEAVAVGNRRLDDGSSPPINLSQPFRYFTQSYDSLWVNINGGVSFDRPVDDYNPECVSSRKFISPFWADIDISDPNRGVIYFRQTTESVVLTKALTDVKTAFPQLSSLSGLKWALVATWLNVPFYNAISCKSALKNTFQLVLATDGVLSFAIFNYNELQWTTGDANNPQPCTGFGPKPARAGFDSGESMTTLPGSCTNDILSLVSKTMSNTTAGKYVFQVNNATILAPGSTPLPIITNTVPDQTETPTPATSSTPTTTPTTTTLSDEQLEFKLHQKRLKAALEAMKPTLMADCMKIVDRIALQKHCFMLLEELSNLEFEVVERATKLDELTIIDVELDQLKSKISSMEADING